MFHPQCPFDLLNVFIALALSEETPIFVYSYPIKRPCWVTLVLCALIQVLHPFYLNISYDLKFKLPKEKDHSAFQRMGGAGAGDLQNMGVGPQVKKNQDLHTTGCVSVFIPEQQAKKQTLCVYLLRVFQDSCLIFIYRDHQGTWDSKEFRAHGDHQVSW